MYPQLSSTKMVPNPRQVPIGPNAVIDDNITFARA
jgi:hypothetical protein